MAQGSSHSWTVNRWSSKSRLSRYRLLPPAERGAEKMNQPLLAVNNLTHLYAPDKGFVQHLAPLRRQAGGDCLQQGGFTGAGLADDAEHFSAAGRGAVPAALAVRHERSRTPPPAAHRMGGGASAPNGRSASPRCGVRRAEIAFSRVVLPEPDSPTMPSTSPGHSYCRQQSEGQKK
jgi:hypothetical protein